MKIFQKANIQNNKFVISDKKKVKYNRTLKKALIQLK